MQNILFFLLCALLTGCHAGTSRPELPEMVEYSGPNASSLRTFIESIEVIKLDHRESITVGAYNAIRSDSNSFYVGDMLNGLTFGNFCDCLDLLQQSKQAAAEKDDPAINEIFQDITLKLYRYKDPEKTPAVPSLLAIHAVNFFSAVWEMVLSGPVYIGGEAIDFRILFQKLASEDRKADDKTGWTGIVFEVAASGVFGNKKEVDDTPFWDVLLYLYKCKFEYLHQKRNKE